METKLSKLPRHSVEGLFNIDEAECVMKVCLAEDVKKLEMLCDELLSALLEAKETIKTWHNMGHSEKESEYIWQIYSNRAPEMLKLNETIKKATGFMYENLSADDPCPDCGVLLDEDGDCLC